MFNGPINKDNSGKYVGRRVGSSGIDEDTVMLGKPKKSLSEQVGHFYDRCVEVILHPQRTYRERRELRQAIKGKTDYDKKAIQKRIRDRTAFSVESEDIAKGLKKVEQKAREDQHLPVGGEQMTYEQERTRALRLGLDNEEILPPWKHDDQYREETDQIRANVRKELEERKEFNAKMKTNLSQQFGPENEEVAHLKAEVAKLRELERKWEDRLGALRWYQNAEKRVHPAFVKDSEFGEKMTRDAIYEQYEKAFEAHQAAREQLAQQVEVLGKRHDQERFPLEQMKVVNEGLAEFKAQVAVQFDKDFHDANPALLLVALKADPNLRTSIYGNIVEGKLKDVREEIEALESEIKNSPNTNPFGISTALQKAHTDLAAKRIMYGALYRMTMMSRDQKEFEGRIDEYLKGEADPEEKRVVEKAKEREEASLALLKARTQRPYFWNVFSSDGKSEPSRSKKRPVRSRSMELQEKAPLVSSDDALLSSHETTTSSPLSSSSVTGSSEVATGDLLGLLESSPPAGSLLSNSATQVLPEDKDNQ